MPRVPSRLPQQGLQPGRLGGFAAGGVVPPRDVTGAQTQDLGAGIASAGAAASQLGGELQNDLDHARTTQAYNRWSQRISATFYDPDNGYLNTVGEGAIGESRTRAVATIERSAQEIITGLDTQVQRGMFRDLVQRRMIEVGVQVDQHHAQQAKVFHIGEAKAMRDAEVSASIQNQLLPGGEVAAMAHRNTAVSQAMVVAKGLGYGPARTDEVVLETTTAIHSGVVDQLLTDQRGSDAAAYLADVPEGEIAPQDRGRLQEAVRRASLGDEAARKAIGMVRDIEGRLPAGTPLENPTLVLNIALQELDAELEAGTITEDLHNATFDRIKERMGLRQNEQAGLTRKLLNDSETFFNANPLAGISQMPGSLLSQLDARGELDTVKAWLNNGRQYSTDNDVYQQMIVLPDDVLRRVTADVFWSRMRPSLNDSDLNYAMARHAKANSLTVDDDSIVSGRERVDEAIFASGILNREAGENGPEDKERAALVRFEIQRRVTTASAAGKPITGEPLQEIIDGVLKEDIVRVEGELVPAASLHTEEIIQGADVTFFVPASGRPFNPTSPLGSVLDEVTVKLAAIPTSVRGSIDQVLRRGGGDPTEKDIARLWHELGRPVTQEAVTLALRKR